MNWEEYLDRPHDDSTRCFFVGGRWNGRTMTVGLVKKLGIAVGKSRDYSDRRSLGFGACPARVFDNAPLIEGYVGPMAGDEDAPLRYESPEAYAMFSD